MIAFGPLYFLFKESDGVLLACVPCAYDFILAERADEKKNARAVSTSLISKFPIRRPSPRYHRRKYKSMEYRYGSWFRGLRNPQS